MDPTNPVIQHCLAGTQAEFNHRPVEARRLFWQAWEAARDDYEACIAAHYVARFQETALERLRWNQEALRHAAAADPERVKDFYPSLYLNLGQSYVALGDQAAARRWYDQAAALGVTHQEE